MYIQGSEAFLGVGFPRHRQKSRRHHISKTEEAANQLREEISNGVHPENQPFYSEHELCERFTLSRMTVRNVLKILEAEGIIFRVPKKGTFLVPSRERTHLRLALLLDSEVYLNSPFLARVLQGLQQELVTQGASLLLPGGREGIHGLADKGRCNGALLLPGGFSGKELEDLRAMPVPVCRIAETEVPFPGAHLHVARSARQLARGFLRRGARRVALLAGHGGFLDREKMRGIKEAIAESSTLRIAYTGYDPAQVAPALRKWFAGRGKPDAIIAFDDTLAFVAMQWLQEQGAARRTLLAGFNDTPVAGLMSLTSVAVPVEAAAEYAVRNLVHAIRNDEPMGQEDFSCRIIWRSSTGDGA